jgi:ferredoxin
MESVELMGVTFRCRGGGCGACKTSIIEGAENLSSLSKNEKEYDKRHGLCEDERLMCQAKILSGEVHIEPREPEFDALGRRRRTLPILPVLPSLPQESNPEFMGPPAA